MLTELYTQPCFVQELAGAAVEVVTADDLVVVVTDPCVVCVDDDDDVGAAVVVDAPHTVARSGQQSL